MEQSPGKKQRRRRKDARPGEIVDAAMRLWALKGFAATRLEDVAAEAGVAKGTIYLYFTSKEALFERAIETHLVATMDAVRARGAAFSGTTEELLREVFRLLLQEIADKGRHVFVKVLIAEGHRFPSLVHHYRTVAIGRGMEAVRSILARGAARGELVPDAAETDVRLVIGPLLLATLWDNVFNQGAAPEREKLVDAFVGLLLNGLRPRSP